MSRVTDEEARMLAANTEERRDYPRGGWEFWRDLAADLLDARARVAVLEGVLRGLLAVVEATYSLEDCPDLCGVVVRARAALDQQQGGGR